MPTSIYLEPIMGRPNITTIYVDKERWMCNANATLMSHYLYNNIHTQNIEKTVYRNILHDWISYCSKLWCGLYPDIISCLIHWHQAFLTAPVKKRAQSLDISSNPMMFMVDFVCESLGYHNMSKLIVRYHRFCLWYLSIRYGQLWLDVLTSILIVDLTITQYPISLSIT